jgi:hypothetical protein
MKGRCADFYATQDHKVSSSHEVASCPLDAPHRAKAYFGVPLTHVIGQKLHVLALVDHHLLWNELKDGVLITVSSPVLFHFVQLSSHLLGLIANSTCLQQAVVAVHNLFPRGVAPVPEHTMIQRKG